MATDDITIVVRAQDSFSGVLGNFGNIITGIKSALDLAGDAMRAFTGFAMEGLDAIASWERLTATMETLVAKELLATGAFEDMSAALAEAGPKAEELLNWIQQLAINSPFTTEGVANAFRLSLAYGFTADEAQRLTEAMINFAAGSGASETVMSQIALALGQIQAKGKLAGQEVLQLVNAGLPVTQILADAFNVTTAEIEQMRTDGLIPADEAIRAITEYLETNFAGAAERQAQSWAGLQGTFQDIKQMGLREFFGGLFETLQPLAIELSNFLQAEGMDRFREWGTSIGEMTQRIIDMTMAVPEMIANFREFVSLNFGEAIANFQEFGDMFIQDIIPILQEHFPIIAGLFQDFADNVLPDLIGVLNALSEWFIEHEDLIVATVEGMIRIFEGLIQVINILWDVAGPIFVGLTGAILGVAEAAMTIFTVFDNLGSRIVGAFQSIPEGMFGVGVNMVASLTGGMTGGLTSVFAGIYNIVTGIIGYFKSLLGISSPSTVFMEIGRDIVQGLIMGWGTAIGSFLSVVQGFINTVLSLFEPILSIFGIDLNLGGSTGGTTGSMPGDTSHTPGGGGVLGSGVVNHFYGPVYFGTLEQLGYDCPSPHPLVAQSSQSLLMSTIG
jgi:tape measure domain-containing protein